MTAHAFVAGVGVRGPGLDGWNATRSVLTGAQQWTGTEIVVPAPALLPPNERRRAGLPVRLALAVGEEAVRHAGLDLASVRGVFASGNGEGAILHGLLETLASDASAISPTQFHNSVHNAAAGYWAMGAQSRQPMTCLGANADSFAAGLLKAVAEAAAEQTPVLLCVYDVPLPDLLAAKQPTGCAFACALALTPTPSRALAALRASWQSGPPTWDADRPAGPAWAALSKQNPAAKSLRLLQAIATGRPDHMAFGLLDGALLVQVDPCLTATPSAP